MKKLAICFLLIITGLCACRPEEEVSEKDSACRNNPLGAECFAPEEPEFIERTPEDEYEIEEDFESDFPGSSPLSWLLYRNDMYEITSVRAVVVEEEENKYVSLYSDGKKGPLYHPMDRSLIFSRPFNLDYSKSGYALTDIYLPKDINNDVFFEIATGAVAMIGIKINKARQVTVVTGGQFHFYEVVPPIYATNVVLEPDTWYRLCLTWNLEAETIAAYLDGDQVITLYSGTIHRSNRYSAVVNGEVLPPNIIRFTMPKLITANGYAYIDNVIVKGGN